MAAPFINHSKLHSIYATIESTQYSKAAKQCLQHPDNVMAMALLAHCYVKLGQRTAGLLVLGKILPPFSELKYEIDQSLLLERNVQAEQRLSTSDSVPSAVSSSSRAKNMKGGKVKNGNGSTLATIAPAQNCLIQSEACALLNDHDDCVDCLDSPPAQFKQDWDQLPQFQEDRHRVIAQLVTTDESLLSTLTVLIRNTLGLPLTSFQLILWVMSQLELIPPSMLSDAFCAGFPVLLSPRYLYMTETILVTMQGIAMKYAKQPGKSFAWAAQTAYWQWKYAEDFSPSRPMFLRLAESLCIKCLDHPSTLESTQIQSEVFLLYMNILDCSGQYEKLLAAIDVRLTKGDKITTSNGMHDFCQDELVASCKMMYPSRHVLLNRQAQVLQKVNRFCEARMILENELLISYPDDWSFWKRHVECALAECAGEIEGIGLSLDHASAVMDRSYGHSRHPLRGPRLLQVYIAFECYHRSHSSSDLEKLAQEIKMYGTEFAYDADCIFSDLSPYIEHRDSIISDEWIGFCESLLEWIQQICVSPQSCDVSERRRELRIYIFAIKMSGKLLRKSRLLALRKKFFPWDSLLKVWKAYQPYDSITEGDQKENRPADDLILLAVQQLLFQDDDLNHDYLKLQVAASILETGISYSPHNAHLKISAIFVYAQLNAASRSWELFEGIYVKHIQHESLSYLILPILWSEGMYIEAVRVCKDIIRLHRTAANDAGEHCGRAMMNVSLSQAEEFMRFQRERMNNSLACFEAKGIILEGAPFFALDAKQQTLGAMQGIVGGVEDTQRAYEMVMNLRDPYAAFSALRCPDNADDFSDNRDFGVLTYDLLTHKAFDTQQKIILDTRRRGYVQNLLIRSVLVVEATKGPKKGKVVATNDCLRKRSFSLLEHTSTVTSFCDKNSDTQLSSVNKHFLRVMVIQCLVIVLVSAGIRPNCGTDNVAGMEERERISCSLLDQARHRIESVHADMMSLNFSELSQAIPECILPVFVIFEKCAQVFDLYGWGKRKCKTKKSSSALTGLSVSLCAMIDGMLLRLSCLVNHAFEPNHYRRKIVPEIVTEAVYMETLSTIVKSQQLAKDRTSRVLLDLKSIVQAHCAFDS